MSILPHWWTSVISKNAASEANMSKVSRTRACSLFWTGLVCVSNDSSQSDGSHCKTSWLCRTGSRRRIFWHPSKNKWWLMDPSSTTQVAQILVRHWRSSGSSWTKFVRTPTRWTVVGKTVRGSSVGIYMGNSTELGMSTCSSKIKIILIDFTWMIIIWLERSRLWLPGRRNGWSMLILTNQLQFLIT